MKKRNVRGERTTVVFEPALAKNLKIIAALKGESLSQVISAALVVYLKAEGMENPLSPDELVEKVEKFARASRDG